MAPLAKSDHNTINITLNIFERCNKKLLKCQATAITKPIIIFSVQS